MGNNRVFSFKTDFKGRRKEYLGIQVTPEPESSVSQPFKTTPGNPVKVSVDVESQPIKVEVYDNETPQDVKDFYLDLGSSEFTKKNMEKYWLIFRSSCLFSNRPVFMSLLPEKLNKWPLRLLLSPLEFAWVLIKFPVQLAWNSLNYFARSIKKIYEFVMNGSEQVNITVGGPEG